MGLKLKDLLTALGDRSRDSKYFLDKKSGKLYCIKVDNLQSADTKEFMILRQKEPERCVEIPKLPSEEQYKDMKAFLGTLKDIKLSERLDRLIDGSGSYRDFLDGFAGKENEKQNWYNFRDRRLKERLQSWLKTQGLGNEPLL